MSFTVFPAIDLRRGQVVRLRQGDPQTQTVFSPDPRASAERWITAGAEWLHVVNLDGAFGEPSRANWAALASICALGARVQFGGGIRSLAAIDRALKTGAERIVLGTAAVERPTLVAEAVARYGADRIVVGVDARQGQVQTRGWRHGETVSPVDLGHQIRAHGVNLVVHTDIDRDGVMSGANLESSLTLAGATGLAVIASGGVSGEADILRAHAWRDRGLVGIIVGRALYEGRVDLAAALRRLSQS